MQGGSTEIAQNIATFMSKASCGLCKITAILIFFDAGLPESSLPKYILFLLESNMFPTDKTCQTEKKKRAGVNPNILYST